MDDLDMHFLYVIEPENKQLRSNLLAFSSSMFDGKLQVKDITELDNILRLLQGLIAIGFEPLEELRMHFKS